MKYTVSELQLSRMLKPNRHDTEAGKRGIKVCRKTFTDSFSHDAEELHIGQVYHSNQGPGGKQRDERQKKEIEAL